MTDDQLVLVRSDDGRGGWSLHRPDATDEGIATGEASDLPLVTGEAEWDADRGAWTRPDDADYAAAIAALTTGRPA